MKRACPSPPRFRSQAFSTSQRFPGSGPKDRGLVSCHSRSWDPPFRAFPSQGSRAPLEAAGSPAVIHRRAETRRTSPFTARFTDVHAFTRLPGFPDDYGLPFHEPRSASWLSWAQHGGVASFRQLHLLRSFVPPARPFAVALSCLSTAGRYSPGLFLFEAFPSTPWILDPPRLSRLNTRLRPKTPARDSKDRRPLESGETFLSTSTQEDLVDGFQTP
jgi:hypothetical protein